jgi:hypothetical protein
MPWVSKMGTYHENANRAGGLPVNDRVRKILEWMHSTRITRRATDVRELGQQSHHTLELVQEAVREVDAPFIAVEQRRLKKVRAGPTHSDSFSGKLSGVSAG